MNDKSEIKLTIGLPDGRHIRDATCELLGRAKLKILEYKDITKRKYVGYLELPSGRICKIIIDKPKDLLYSLILGKTDIIITGQDIITDFYLFHNIYSNSNFKSNWIPIESAHILLEHLGFFGTQLAFMVREDNTFKNLDELIMNQESIVCYTEFPMIASRYLSHLNTYRLRFKNSLPTIIANFASIENNPNVIIIYSHGATEAKAAIDSSNIVLDLILTSKTLKTNNLKILQKVMNPIYNLIYKRKIIKRNNSITEFVELIEKTIEKYPKIYTISETDNQKHYNNI